MLVLSDVNTLADSIAVGTPRNWRRALKQIRLSSGEMIAVSDDEILEAMRTTARIGAVFGEPAGVTGVAGLKKAIQKGIVKKSESVLCHCHPCDSSSKKKPPDRGWRCKSATRLNLMVG